MKRKSIAGADAKKKGALLKQMSKLKSELKKLSKTHRDEARSIAGFAEVAAHEATRKAKAAKLRKLSNQGLSASVQGFEATHPNLVEIVNEISLILARIGI